TMDAAEIAARKASGAFDIIYERFEPIDTDPALSAEFWKQPDKEGWQREFNALFDKQAKATSKVDRLQLFATAQRLYIQHMPSIALAAPHAYVAASMRALNLRPSPHRPWALQNADVLAALKPPS